MTTPMSFELMVGTLISLMDEIDSAETPTNVGTLLGGLDPVTALHKSLTSMKAVALEGNTSDFDLAVLKQALEAIDLARP